jgi:hypothetical protein
LTGVVSIEPWHPDVEQDHLGLVLLEHRQRAVAVTGHSRVTTHFFDEHGRGFRRILVIIDHQNSLVEPAAKGRTLEPFEGGRERYAVGDGPPQDLDRLLDSLGSRIGVSGRPALADEKAAVTDDAVADLAESREMDEQAAELVVVN